MQKNKSGPKGQAGAPMKGKKLGDTVTNGGRSVITRNNTPKVANTTAGGVRVRNTERLGTINCTVAGNVTRQGFPFNPASPSLFPWLSNIAKNYSMYRVHKLEWSYAPIVPTTVTGEAALGVVYDVEDADNFIAGGTIEGLSQLGEYAAGPPYAGGSMTSAESQRGTYFGLKADTALAHRRSPWFIVNPGSTTDADRNLSTLAVLLSACYSSSAGGNGVLYATYDIEFIKPCAPDFQ